MTAAKTVTFQWKGDVPILQGLPWTAPPGGAYQSVVLNPGDTVKVPAAAKRSEDGRTWLDHYRGDPNFEEVKPAPRKKRAPAKPKS